MCGLTGSLNELCSRSLKMATVYRLLSFWTEVSLLVLIHVLENQIKTVSSLLVILTDFPPHILS